MKLRKILLTLCMAFVLVGMTGMFKPVETQGATTLTKTKVKNSSFTFTEGAKKKKIQFRNLPSGATKTFKSSNKKVAKVTKYGYIYPKGKGSCTITCTVKYNGKTKKLKVNVKVNGAEQTAATPTPVPTSTSEGSSIKIEYSEEGITVTEDGLERHYHYDDLEPEEIADLINYGVSEDELKKHGITPTPKPTPILAKKYKAGDLITDESGLTGIVVSADDYRGIYTDDEGNRQVMVPEGFTADDETVYYDEDGKPIITYFQAASARMADFLTYNDYDRWLAGSTRYQIENSLIYDGFSKAEIEWALRDYDKTLEEQTAMLVQWAMFSGVASSDTIEDYVKDRGGDPSLIDWSMLDDNIALMNFVHNLQSDIPNIPLEDVKEFAKSVGGFTDITGIEKYFDYDIYNANK